MTETRLVKQILDLLPVVLTLHGLS
jgi:hypothetical protein